MIHAGVVWKVLTKHKAKTSVSYKDDVIHTKDAFSLKSLSGEIIRNH